MQPTLDEGRWPAATSVFSAKAPMPSAGASSVPSVRVIFWVASKLAKQNHVRPRLQPDRCRRRPAVEDHVVAGRQCAYAIADRFDDASGFVSE